MKTTFFSLIFTCVIIMACSGNSNKQTSTVQSNSEQKQLQGSNNVESQVLTNTEQKVYNAFVQAKISLNDSAFMILEGQLIALNNAKPNAMIVYWYAYTCYYHSIYYLIAQQNKLSNEFLEKGIEKLEQIDPKNSEHYALLALMTSFSMQFASGFQAPFIARKISGYNELAIDLDSTNLRAWFVNGSSDFYTPEKYGGGKKAEYFLKKAIALKDQTIVNPYLPGWGRNQAYELLIRFYLRQNKKDLAVQYYKQAHSLFPDDYMINKLASELLN